MKFNKKALVVLLFVITVVSSGCGRTSPNGLHSLETVVNTLAFGGIKLTTDHAKSPEAYELRGKEPAVFKIGSTDDNLLIYIYETFADEEERFINAFSFERIPFISRNTLIIYIPSKAPNDQDSMESIVKTANRISEIVFKYMNHGKEVVYRGESTHWEPKVTLKYYQNLWHDEDGKRHYQSYHIENYELQYRLTEIESVGPISYKYKHGGSSGGGTGLTLDNEGYIDAGSSGGNGWLSSEPEKDVFHITITWDDKEEELDLTAQD